MRIQVLLIGTDYIELLYAFTKEEERLARNLETPTVLSGLSNRIQNDLIEAISDVIRNNIKKEINTAPFLAVEVDATMGVVNNAQIAVMLRYAAKSEAACDIREF